METPEKEINTYFRLCKHHHTEHCSVNCNTFELLRRNCISHRCGISVCEINGTLAYCYLMYQNQTGMTFRVSVLSARKYQFLFGYAFDQFGMQIE